MISRREFVEFMAKAGLLASFGCAGSQKAKETPAPTFQALSDTGLDALILAEGFKSTTLARFGDVVGTGTFGYGNDGLAFLPLRDKGASDALLWVNHAIVDPFIVSGYRRGIRRTREQAEKEMLATGASVLHVRYHSGQWRLIKDSAYNRRLNAQTPVHIVNETHVSGGEIAMGLVGLRGATVTPWRTILACEGGYDGFFGEVRFANKKRLFTSGLGKGPNWAEFFPRPPEHYGWICEIDPRSGRSRKLISAGRVSRSNVVSVLAKDGRVVVYSLADSGLIFKYVAREVGSLDHGSLSVASSAKQAWIPIDFDKDPRLQKAFESRTEMLIRAAEAAKLVGGESTYDFSDVIVDNATGDIYLSVGRAKNYEMGGIYKISEADKDCLATTFTSTMEMRGEDEKSFICPGSLSMDPKGNLWIVTAIDSANVGKIPYQHASANMLFVLPMSGPERGRAIKVATAPKGTYFRGPRFSHDGRTLFISVQPQLGAFNTASEASNKSYCVALSGPSVERLSEK